MVFSSSKYQVLEVVEIGQLLWNLGADKTLSLVLSRFRTGRAVALICARRFHHLHAEFNVPSGLIKKLFELRLIHFVLQFFKRLSYS
jgi:hypothetical protein